MQRDQLPRARQAATFVLPRWKLVYISNPKAACTSIKWLLADLQGAEHQPFYDTLKWETSRDGTIHHGRRQLWPETPRLKSLTDAQLAEITPDNGWFVFTASRHPASRLWSGWQSKLLLRQPRYAAKFAAEPWFPRIPRTTDDVLEDWFRFVQYLREGKVVLFERDVHFRPQAQQLAIGQMPYDRVYDTSEFRVLLDDISAHLRSQGWNGELHVRRSNETPLASLAAGFPDQVLDAIQEIYRVDYEAFDYPRTVPRGTRPDEAYSTDLIATVGMLVERHERISDLSKNAQALRRRARRRKDGGNRKTAAGGGRSGRARKRSSSASERRG